MNKWWLILKKQEMTKLWINDSHVVVSLLKLVPQEIIRYKNIEKDWYVAAIVWTWKKTLNKEKWIKEAYDMVTEFKIQDDFVVNHEAGSILDLSLLEGCDYISMSGISKWKGFQWVIRRHNFAWWPATHGSKFHRRPGSIGNRKPRRVNKWHPLPWHMGIEKVTLKNIKIVDRLVIDNESFIAVKWSVPGYYNSLLKVYVQ